VCLFEGVAGQQPCKPAAGVVVFVFDRSHPKNIIEAALAVVLTSAVLLGVTTAEQCNTNMECRLMSGYAVRCWLLPLLLLLLLLLLPLLPPPLLLLLLLLLQVLRLTVSGAAAAFQVRWCLGFTCDSELVLLYSCSRETPALV